MKQIKLLSFLFIAALSFTSCSDDDNPVPPAPTHEEEVITTMRIVLTKDGTTETVTIESKDADGDGPNPPVITDGTLSANTKYNAVITLWNELEDPADDITKEIKEEADEHQFFYSAQKLSSTFAYAGENDSKGNPVGLEFTVNTGTAGVGTYTVILRHEPNKTAAGVKDGDITNADGETDIEVVFPITIQ
ncbi:type 1 periplasmic binding fold superfamily protein [Tenacibaculum sp. 190524A02b]|uniref:Type 1 periplasmic binding fold superfamily protein n=1 Tax=Tenacibaculum vairaonense TaxID=3137860 RepID=A0ABM9PR23_9FLAO